MKSSTTSHGIALIKSFVPSKAVFKPVSIDCLIGSNHPSITFLPVLTVSWMNSDQASNPDFARSTHAWIPDSTVSVTASSQLQMLDLARSTVLSTGFPNRISAAWRASLISAIIERKKCNCCMNNNNYILLIKIFFEIFIGGLTWLPFLFSFHIQKVSKLLARNVWYCPRYMMRSLICYTF